MMSLIYLFATKAYAVGIGVDVGSARGSSTYNTYINAFLEYSIIIGLSLSVMMFVYAGLKYISSQGNQTAISDAKDIVTGTLIGFLMLILMNALLKFFVNKPV